MAEYIKITPSPVYAITFEGQGEISTSDLRACVPDLSNACETFSAPPAPPTTIHSPLVLSSQTVTMPDGTQRSYADCLWSCLTGDTATVTTGAAGGSAVASGLVPKRLIGVRVVGTPFTSVPSIIAHKFPHLDRDLPKWISGKTPTMSFKRLPPQLLFRSTTSTLRFVGRWIPIIGWGLLAADIIIFDQCVARCRNQKSFLGTIWDETFAIKPAY